MNEKLYKKNKFNLIKWRRMIIKISPLNGKSKKIKKIEKIVLLMEERKLILTTCLLEKLLEDDLFLQESLNKEHNKKYTKIIEERKKKINSISLLDKRSKNTRKIEKMLLTINKRELHEFLFLVMQSSCKIFLTQLGIIKDTDNIKHKSYELISGFTFLNFW